LANFMTISMLPDILSTCRIRFRLHPRIESLNRG
jgi:hypothetical protein